MRFGKFPPRWQDQPYFYIEELAWPLFPWRGTTPYPGTHGHLDASTDRSWIRECQQRFPGCRWARRTSALQPALDYEQKEIQGKDGATWLRRHAEALRLSGNLTLYGETPIDISRNGGFHSHHTGPGGYLPSRLLLPHIELKADNASISLPPGPECIGWDNASPPTLPPAPLQDWVLALTAVASEGRRKKAPSLPLEGLLGEQEATALGAYIAGRIVDKALASAWCLADARTAARGLGWLAAEGRISTGFAWRALDRLGKELPDFGESGFNREGLQRTLHATYERRCRRA
jgi:hypothetical protein